MVTRWQAARRLIRRIREGVAADGQFRSDDPAGAETGGLGDGGGGEMAVLCQRPRNRGKVQKCNTERRRCHESHTAAILFPIHDRPPDSTMVPPGRCKVVARMGICLRAG